MPSSVNFNNLITIPLQTKPTLANDISIALFNARSVNSPEKRTEINTFITDDNIQLMFLTETWLRARGDDARCSDLTPAGYSIRFFPRPSRGADWPSSFTTATPLASPSPPPSLLTTLPSNSPVSLYL